MKRINCDQFPEEELRGALRLPAIKKLEYLQKLYNQFVKALPKNTRNGRKTSNTWLEAYF